MKKTIGALVAVLLLCVPGSAVADSHLSADPAVRNARALLSIRSFEQALAILRPLEPDHPDRTDILFLTGVAAIGASQAQEKGSAARAALLDEAIAALRAILIDRPELVRVRLELARAFFLKGEDGLARGHFERVLAGKPPRPVVVNVRRFLRAIRARRRWDMHLGFSLVPDSNIGAASNERTIYIGGLPFRFNDAESRTTSGVGVAVWAGGEYQHPLSERLRLRARADISRREYSGGRFDQMFVSGHAGPRLLATESTDVSVLASIRHGWAANRPDYHDLGLRTEVVHRIGRGLTVKGRGSWHNRRYRTRTHLDGPSLDVSLSGAWVITPTVRADVASGYGRGRPDTERWRYARRWARAGLSYALPYGFTVGGSGELRRTQYEGNWGFYTPGGVSRKDRTRSLRVSVYNRAFTLYGFSPQVSVVHEVRKTNAQLYDYKRTGGELRFVRQF